MSTTRYLAFVHVQSLRAKSQLPLCSIDRALQEALLLLKLPHHLQLSVDLPEKDKKRQQNQSKSKEQNILKSR